MSGPEDLRLGRREFFVSQRARVVQLCEVLDLVGWIRRGRHGLRLVLAVVGRRLIVALLLFVVPLRRVVSGRSSDNCSCDQCPAPRASPESHDETPSRSFGVPEPGNRRLNFDTND